MRKQRGENFSNQIDASKELIEKNRETWLREIINDAISEGKKIGEGQDGVILLLESEKYPELSTKLGTNSEHAVSKLMKISSGVTSKHEFAMHDLAYKKISEIQKQNPERKFAQIPKPILETTLAVDDQEQKNNLAGLKIGDNAEAVDVIIMDFIEGQSIAEWIYKHSLKTLSKEKLDEFGLDHKRIDQLQASELFIYVGQAFGVTRDNYEFLIKRIAGKPGIELPKKFLEKAQAALSELHKANLYHADLHPGNIMIDKDGEPVIIDFGRSRIITDGTDPYNQDSDKEKRIPDNYLINQLKAFEGKNQKLEKFLQLSERRFGRFLLKFKGEPEWERVLNAKETKDAIIGVKLLLMKTGSNLELSAFLLVNLFEKIPKEKKHEIIIDLQKTNLPLRNKLSELGF